MLWCIDQLADIGEAEDVIPCSHEERGRAVHGFSYSDHDSRLDMFITSIIGRNRNILSTKMTTTSYTEDGNILLSLF